QFCYRGNDLRAILNCHHDRSVAILGSRLGIKEPKRHVSEEDSSDHRWQFRPDQSALLIGPWDGLHSVPSHPGPTAIELRSADFSPPRSRPAKTAGSGLKSALLSCRNSLNSMPVHPDPLPGERENGPPPLDHTTRAFRRRPDGPLVVGLHAVESRIASQPFSLPER